MRKIAIALLATTVIGAPAIAAPNNGQSSNQQQPQQQQTNQMQPQQNTQDQRNQQQAAQENQMLSPRILSRSQVKQVQQALDKDGFTVPTDGWWGPKTENAVKQFQQSKQIQANGQLDRQTVSDLGLNASQFSNRSPRFGWGENRGGT
jgi:hypothetical protein